MTGKLALDFDNPREIRGCKMINMGHEPTQIKDNIFKFKSESTDTVYTVIQNSHGWECSCPDFEFRGRPQGFDCKHIKAVKIWKTLREALYHDDTIEITPSVSTVIYCKHCESSHVVKNGTRKTKYGKKPAYLCRDCGRYFTFEDEFTGFNGMRHNDPKVITACLDMYFRGASLRSVAEHVSAFYGIKVSHSTIYRWITKFTKVVDSYINTLEPEISEKWNTDEMFITTGKKLFYVWNVMDSDSRYLLANLVSKKRTIKVATKVFKKAKDHAGGKKPFEVVTDGLYSYKKAFNKVFYDHHRSCKHIHNVGIQGVKNNNRVERYHGSVRDREKVFRGVNGDVKALQSMMDGYRVYHNYVKKHQTLGMTPAEKAGINLELGDNRWLGLIEKAVEYQKNGAN